MGFTAELRQRSAKTVACAGWVLVALTCAAGSGPRKQQQTLANRIQGRVKVSDDSGLLRAQLQRLEGQVLAEGSNGQPVGQYRITRYRIEEITPPAPIVGEADGQAVVLEKVWRVSIIGGPFDMRDAPAVIWIDDEPVGFGIESRDLTTISTLIFDRRLLKSGARLALSYGIDRERRNVLPETINMSRTR